MSETRRFFKSTFRLAVFIGALVAKTGTASALVVDDFSQGPISLQATNVTGQTLVQNGLDPSSVLGGSRSIHVGSLNLASATLDTTKGRFDFRADASFGYFTLEWGSVTPLNVNLTAGGNTEFALNFVDVTPGINSGIFDFLLESGNTWFTYDFSKDLFNTFKTQTFGTVAIPFSRFTGTSLADVQAIEISASRFQPMGGLSIDSITAVPEPAITALTGVTLILLFGTFRRAGACR